MAIRHAGMPICILYFKLSFAVKGKIRKYNRGFFAVWAQSRPGRPVVYNFSAFGHMKMYMVHLYFNLTLVFTNIYAPPEKWYDISIK